MLKQTRASKRSRPLKCQARRSVVGRYSPGTGPNSVNFRALDGAQAGLLAVPLKAVVSCSLLRLPHIHAIWLLYIYG